MNSAFQLEAFVKIVVLFLGLASSQSPPQPENINLLGTSFLDHDAPLSSFWGQTFLQENIPFIDISDSSIQDVYYYRWSSIQRHLRYTTAGTGYILTEFCQPGAYLWLLEHFYMNVSPVVIHPTFLLERELILKSAQWAMPKH
jgi:hypothetical protein